MQNLFFIIALVMSFSGTSLVAVAQKNKHQLKPATAVPAIRQVKFIEGIEINREPATPSEFVCTTHSETAALSFAAIGDIEKTLPVQFKYAQLLNRNIEAITNIPLFNFIDEWWETRYQYGGTSKSGIDCSAFTGLLCTDIYAEEVPRTAREQYNACEKMDRAELKEGDFVFFNTRGGVSHVGIYLGDGYFVHASTKNGVTINNLDDDYYSARFLGGGRFTHASTDAVVKAGQQ